MYFLFHFILLFSCSQFPNERAHCWCCWWKTNRCLFQSPSHQSNCRCHSIWKRFCCCCSCVRSQQSMILLCFYLVFVGDVVCSQIVNEMSKKSEKTTMNGSTIFDFYSLNWWPRERVLTQPQNMESETQTQGQYFGILSSFLLREKQKLHSWINIFLPSIRNHVIYWIKSDVVCMYHSDELIFIHISLFECRLPVTVGVCVCFSSAPSRECIRFFSLPSNKLRRVEHGKFDKRAASTWGKETHDRHKMIS